MTIYGYARVSTDGQTRAAQDAQLSNGETQADIARTYGVDAARCLLQPCCNRIKILLRRKATRSVRSLRRSDNF